MTYSSECLVRKISLLPNPNSSNQLLPERFSGLSTTKKLFLQTFGHCAISHTWRVLAAPCLLSPSVTEILLTLHILMLRYDHVAKFSSKISGVWCWNSGNAI